MTTFGKTILDLNLIEKINWENYNIWQHKVQFALEEVEALKFLNHKMLWPKNSGHQGCRDPKIYNDGGTWIQQH